MPTNTRNPNPTNNDDAKDHDPPKKFIPSSVREIRQGSQKKPNPTDTTTTQMAGAAKERNASTALEAGYVSAELQILPQSSEAVRTDAFVTTRAAH